jgi:hypothetical protein
MRNTAALIVLFVIGLLGGSLAQAPSDVPNNAKVISESGIVLMDYCQWVEREKTDVDQWAQQTTCLAYIFGVIDGYYSARPKLPVFCYPAEVTGEQAGRVVNKYLRDGPERLHQRSARLVLDALSEAFPCKAGKRSAKSTREQSSQ